MSGYPLRSEASCSLLVRLYIFLMVCAICTKFSRAALGGNGNSRPRISIPKPGAKPSGKNSSGARHLPPSGKPSSSIPGKHHLPAESRDVEQNRFQTLESAHPPHLPFLQSGRRIPTSQAGPRADGRKLVKELGAKFDRGLRENTYSQPPSGREVRTMKGERTNTDTNDGVTVEAGRIETRVCDFKRMFEQGADLSLCDSSRLPSNNVEDRHGESVPKKPSIPDKRANILKKLTSSANADQTKPVLASRPDIHIPEERHYQADPRTLKPLPLSSVHPASSEAQSPIYENLRSNVPNAHKNCASYSRISEVYGGSTHDATNVYENIQIGASRAHRNYTTGSSNAGEDRKDAPIYDEINDLSRQAVKVFQRPDQPSRKPSRPTEKLLTRRGFRATRQSSRERGESTSGWSVRTLSTLFSYSYLPLAFPLLIAGLFNGDQLLSLAGIVLLGGGSVLNIFSLLALWIRSASPSDIVPMTARNFELMFTITTILVVSTFTVFNFHMTTFLAAVVSTGRSDYIQSVAPVCAFHYALYFAVVIYSVYESVRHQRQRSVADPESADPSDVEFEGEVPSFEMVYSPTTLADNGHSESDERSSFTQRCPTLSRLFENLRLNLYQPFVTFTGVALIAAVCLARYLRPYTRSSPTPPPPDQPSNLPQLSYLVQLIPSLVEDNASISAATPSLLMIGSMGVIYLLGAVGTALLRWLMSCARCIAYSRPCWRRSNRGPRVALTYYLFVLGVSTAVIGFLAAFMEVRGAQSCPSFARILEYGTAMFGMILALLPTLWTTLQSFGLSLSRALLHFHRIDVSRQGPGASSRGYDPEPAQTSPPEESQLPAEGQAFPYGDAEEVAEDESYTEWDSDEE